MQSLISRILTDYDNYQAQGLLSASFFSAVKDISAVLIVAFILLDIYIILGISKLRSGTQAAGKVSEALRANPLSAGRIQRQWGAIKDHLEHPVEAEWKIAVIEADNLVDDVLKKLGYAAPSMGDKLKSIPPKTFSSIDNLWAAHKVRNMIVHDPNARILYRDAREAVANFEFFLKEAQVIE